MAVTRPTVLPVWAEAGDKVQPTDAEIQTGWPLSNVPPSRQRFNWIFNWLANGIRYLTRRGMPDWAATEAYEIGDRVQASDGMTYVAKTANTNKDPLTNAADWERWGYTATEMSAAIPSLANYARKDTAQAFTAGQRGAVVVLVDAATVTPDFNLGNNFSFTIGGNRTLANPINMVAGQSGIIVISQDATGSRTLAFAGCWKFAGGSAPSLTTTASAVDVLAYYVESATRITARLHNDVR